MNEMHALANSIVKDINRLAMMVKANSRQALAERQLEHLLGIFYDAKIANKAIEAQRKKLGVEVETLNKTVLPAEFDRRGFDMFRSPGLGRSFYIRTEYSAQMVDKEAGFDWLKANGGEDLIQPSVNAGSLKAFLREKLDEEGIEAPDTAIKLNSYDTIGSSKYTPKD